MGILEGKICANASKVFVQLLESSESDILKGEINKRPLCVYSKGQYGMSLPLSNNTHTYFTYDTRGKILDYDG